MQTSLYKIVELSDIFHQIASTLGNCHTVGRFCMLMQEQMGDNSHSIQMWCPFSVHPWLCSKLSPDEGFQHAEDLII